MRLRFQDVLGLNKKTITRDVISGELRIGQIKFWPHWRKYCFFPSNDTLYDQSCLGEIKQELEIMNYQRKINGHTSPIIDLTNA